MVKRTEQLCTTPRIGSSGRWECGRINASATPQFHISSVPKCHNQCTAQDWVNSPFLGLSFPPSGDPAARGAVPGGVGRPRFALGTGTRLCSRETECNHTWDLLGESLGLWEGIPRLQAHGRVQPLAAGGCWTCWQLQGPLAPGSSGGRGCDLGLFGRKKKKPNKKRNST